MKGKASATDSIRPPVSQRQIRRTPEYQANLKALREAEEAEAREAFRKAEEAKKKG